MPRASIVRECPIRRSPRVLQIESMMDVPAAEKSSVSWEVHLPLNERPWHVGLIVGPSGSGKSVIAQELFGKGYVVEYDWPSDACLLDGFPTEMPIKNIVRILTGVGLSTVPAWLRPYRVLSTGEKFRATVARALAERNSDHVVVIDEFSSVVDRQVAKVASHATQKMVRSLNCQFVAVSCHYDIVDWLQPDWIYQPASGSFDWRSLQRRPKLDLEIYPVDRSAWRLFSSHHYLSKFLHGKARCFGGFIGHQCIAFTSYISYPHPKRKNICMGHRLVVLPDWQGIGVGGKMDDWLGLYLYLRGLSYHNVVAHPAMIAHYSNSPRWKLIRSGLQSVGSRHAKSKDALSLRKHQQTFSAIRNSKSFVYVPPENWENGYYEELYCG